MLEQKFITMEQMRRIRHILRVAPKALRVVGPDGKESFIWDKERQEWVTTYERAWQLGMDV